MDREVEEERLHRFSFNKEQIPPHHGPHSPVHHGSCPSLQTLLSTSPSLVSKIRSVMLIFWFLRGSFALCPLPSALITHPPTCQTPAHLSACFLCAALGCPGPACSPPCASSAPLPAHDSTETAVSSLRLCKCHGAEISSQHSAWPPAGASHTPVERWTESR